MTKNALASTIAKNIKALRIKVNWNQSTLASKAGVSGAALSMIEQGARVPTLKILMKLACALNVNSSEITGIHPVSRSETEERNQSFYRKFRVIEALSEDDQAMLLALAERLKSDYVLRLKDE